MVMINQIIDKDDISDLVILRYALKTCKIKANQLEFTQLSIVLKNI